MNLFKHQHSTRELTIENLISFIKELELPNMTNNKFDMDEYNGLVGSLLLKFYGPTKYRNDEKFVDKCVIKSVNLIDTDIIAEQTDLQCISFKNLFSHILNELWEADQIEYNIIAFGDLFSFVLKNMDEILNTETITYGVRHIIKMFINCTYGVLNAGVTSNQSPRTGNISITLAPKEGPDCFIKIKNNFSNKYIQNEFYPYFNFLHKIFSKYEEIVLIDTDNIYVKNCISQGLLEDINRLEFDYEVIQCTGLIYSRKNYQITDLDGNILHKLSKKKRS